MISGFFIICNQTINFCGECRDILGKLAKVLQDFVFIEAVRERGSVTIGA